MGQNYYERIFFVRHFDPLIELGSIYNNLVMDNKIRQALLEHLGRNPSLAKCQLKKLRNCVHAVLVRFELGSLDLLLQSFLAMASITSVMRTG